jgi:hypothetical protein
MRSPFNSTGCHTGFLWVNPADRTGRRAGLNNRTSSVLAKGRRQPANTVLVFLCAARGVAPGQRVQRSILQGVAVPLLPSWLPHGGATRPMFARTLTELQTELPALPVNSLHITVDGATHESLVAERKHALVVDAIRRVLEAARTGERVGGTNGDARNVIRPKPGGRDPLDSVAADLGSA